MPTPMTYLPYSFSFMTRLEKSESPESRMNVPISGRVNISSTASIASLMSVAFFLDEPYAVAWMAERSGRRLDLNRTWQEQRLSPALCEAMKRCRP